MKRQKTLNGYYNNKVLCEIEAKKYKNKSELQKNCWAAYNYSYKNGWLNEFYKRNAI
jgi:hypothetical protein